MGGGVGGGSGVGGGLRDAMSTAMYVDVEVVVVENREGYRMMSDIHSVWTRGELTRCGSQSG